MLTLVGCGGDDDDCPDNQAKDATTGNCTACATGDTRAGCTS